MSDQLPPSGSPNWLGLLKWSLSHSDGTRDSSDEVRNLSDEEKSWLSHAMNELVKDEPTRMNEILTQLVKYIDSIGEHSYDINYGRSNDNVCSNNNDNNNNNNNNNNDNDDEQIDEERIYNLLDELKDIVGQIDMAQVCIKFGGLKCFLYLINGPDFLVSDRIKYISCDTIATIAQNNISVQQTFYNQNVVDVLSSNILQLNQSSYSEQRPISSILTMKAKLIYSISCTIRNFSLSEIYFTKKYASEIISSALQSFSHSSSCNPFLRKVLFLSSALFLSEHITNDIKENVFVNMLIPKIFDFLCISDVEIRDISIRLVISISETKYGKLKVFDNFDLLKIFMERRLEMLGKDPDIADYETDETERISEMLKVLHAPFVDTQASGNTNDSMLLIGP